MEPRALGDAPQPGGVAADAGQRDVDEAGAAGVAEAAELRGDQVLVRGQLPVVEALRDLPQVALGVLVGQGEPERRGIDAPEDRLHVGRHARHYRSAGPAADGRVRPMRERVVGASRKVR